MQPERNVAARDCEPVTDVHQCPYCELRFLSRSEMQDHIALEHPADDDDDTITPPPTR
jgi:hypothetical protein